MRRALETFLDAVRSQRSAPLRQMKKPPGFPGGFVDALWFAFESAPGRSAQNNEKKNKKLDKEK